LVVDAPNLKLIGSDDILEEWFIDKHLYHFSDVTLTYMIEAAGFQIIRRPDPSDDINLLFLARKAGPAKKTITADPDEVARSEALIARYQATRAAYKAALVTASREIEGLAPKRVAIWGAGRLFDSLVVTGGLATSHLTLLIDSHLAQHMDWRHGMKLSAPDALATTPVDTIVVMSRGFAGEITAEAQALAPNAEIILYADLLARARLAQAA
jgi:hypothetical protein